MIDLVGAMSAGAFTAVVNVDLPAGVEDGDRLIMLASANDAPLIVSRPPGWAVLTEDDIGTNVATYVWTRIADGEPSSYTVEWDAAHWHFLNLIAFRGVSAIRSHEVDSGDSTAVTDLPVLDGRAGDGLLAFGFNDLNTPKSWPPELSEITNLPRGIISAWQEITEDGPTEPHTLTAGDSGHMAATAILLAPAAPGDPQISRPFQLRAELQLKDAGWTSISGDVRGGGAGDVQITRGRSDEASAVDASRCTLTLDNRSGAYSPRHPDSPHFGLIARNTPLRVGLWADDGSTAWRFAGEVSEWPLRWDQSGNDRTVAIEASGPFRRLSQGEPPTRDALRRAIRQAGPLAYWPITQTGLLRVIPSGIDGGHDMTILTGPYRPGPIGRIPLRSDQLDWQSANLAPHLESVARTVRDFGEITGHVAAGSDAGWAVDLIREGVGGVDRIILRTAPRPDGRHQQWRARVLSEDGLLQVHVRQMQDDEQIGSFVQLHSSEEPMFFISEQPHHVRLQVVPSGGNARWTLFVDGEVIGSGTTGAVGTPDPAGTVTYRWTHSEPDDAQQAGIGHITVWDQSTLPPPPSSLDLTRAMAGFDGERAGVRMHRILTEEGTGLQVVGDLEDTPPMGPQYAEAPLEILRAAEAVDGGILHEARDEVAMVYRTGRSRYLNGRSPL